MPCRAEALPPPPSRRGRYMGSESSKEEFARRPFPQGGGQGVLVFAVYCARTGEENPAATTEGRAQSGWAAVPTNCCNRCHVTRRPHCQERSAAESTAIRCVVSYVSLCGKVFFYKILYLVKGKKSDPIPLYIPWAESFQCIESTPRRKWR